MIIYKKKKNIMNSQRRNIASNRDYDQLVRMHERQETCIIRLHCIFLSWEAIE